MERNFVHYLPVVTVIFLPRKVLVVECASETHAVEDCGFAGKDAIEGLVKVVDMKWQEEAQSAHGKAEDGWYGAMAEE